MTLPLILKLQSTREALPPCRPPIWARTGHLQTIMGHLIPSPKMIETGEEMSVTLESESERIHTTYFKGTTNIVVYLFHGLGGSAEATYMQRTALVAKQLGAHIFINNHRGCGQGVGLATQPYHSGRAEDLSKVIAFGRQKLNHHKHIAIGFSLSANALLLLAAKVRGDVLPDMAIAVNGPIHLDRASIKLTQGLNQIYDKRFVLELKSYIKKNHPQGIARVGKIKDLREFDELYTAPIGGFKSRADYYATCSANQYLSQIKIPTVIITSEDDPFVSSQDYKEATISENVVLHIEKHGGHMGYLNRKGLGMERWLDTALKGYLKSASSFFIDSVS